MLSSVSGPLLAGVWAALALVGDAQVAQTQFGPNAAAGTAIGVNNWDMMQAVSVKWAIQYVHRTI